MVLCNICNIIKVDNIKNGFLKGNIKRFCLSCQKNNKEYIKNLIRIENNHNFLTSQNAIIEREQEQQNEKELKQIPFNCWIIAEREQEKAFFEKQNNKDFLQEQYLNDIVEQEKDF